MGHQSLNIRRTLAFWGGAFVVVPLCGAVHAAAADAESNGSALQEVVVTATRREESLSKVPISVMAIGQDAMDERGIKDIQDIVRYTPGVMIDTAATNQISIRGISSSGGAGTTGVYIDDTPIQMRSVGYNPDDTLPKTFDLQRVEVLRGPQGTLFGAGSEGGTVRYILTPPNLDKSSTYARGEVSWTHYGQPNYEAGVAYGAPVVDGKLGFRASAWYRGDGGWIDRVDPTTRATTEHNVNRVGSVMLRMAGAWRPVDPLTVTASVVYQNMQKHDQPTYWPAYSNPAAGQFNTATPERIPGPDKWYLPALKIEWDLGKSAIISNTSFYHRDERTGYQGTVYDLAYFQSLSWPAGGAGIGSCGALSSSAVPPCSWYPLLDGRGIHLPAGFSKYQTPNVMANSQRSYVQELRWQSTDDNARLRWTVGLFWQLAKEGSDENLTDTQIIPFWQGLFGISPLDWYGAYYSCNGQGVAPAYTGVPNCSIYNLNTTTFDRQIAAYGELNFGITDRLRLTLGERVARTRFSLRTHGDGLENYGPSDASGSQSETPNTPRAGLSFQLDPNNLYYFTYSKGFRVGGGNPPLPPYCGPDLATAGYPNGAPLTYNSDKTQNFEVGAKNLIGGWLRLATSAYYIKWSGIQQSIYVAGGCGLQFTDNLGEAVAKGFDLQADMVFGPVTVDLATGYTEARYTRNSPDRQVCDPVTKVCGPAPRLASDGDAISGQGGSEYAPGLTPPWTVALGAQYNFHLGEHDAFVRADWEYAAKNYWPSILQDPRNDASYNPYTYTLPSTSFTSLRAGVNLRNWQVSAFVDNLLDSHTVINYQLVQYDPNVAINQQTVQQNQYTFRPRTIGVTAVVHIGR